MPKATAERVKAILKAELKRRGVTYADLATRLTAAGSPDTADNIKAKISRGGFSAVFLVECMDAIGCEALRLAD